MGFLGVSPVILSGPSPGVSLTSHWSGPNPWSPPQGIGAIAAALEAGTHPQANPLGPFHQGNERALQFGSSAQTMPGIIPSYQQSQKNFRITTVKKPEGIDPILLLAERENRYVLSYIIQ